MTRFLRTLRASTFGLSLLVACGGKTDAGPDSGATPADTTAVQCLAIDEDASHYDLSCNVDSDCVLVGVGTICGGDCFVCEGRYTPAHDAEGATLAISTNALPKYNAGTRGLASACTADDQQCVACHVFCSKHQCQSWCRGG